MLALWHSGLTLEEDCEIENIQQSSLKIVLHKIFIYSDTALEVFALQKLSQHRLTHCLSFAKICGKKHIYHRNSE